MDLSKILKGHEGESLWSPIYGKCTFVGFENDLNYSNKNIIVQTESDGKITFLSNGKISHKGDVMLFPSEDQRRWQDFKRIEDGSPVMVSLDSNYWCFRYYAKGDRCYDLDSKEAIECIDWEYIVPFANFNPNNLESNKGKSI